MTISPTKTKMRTKFSKICDEQETRERGVESWGTKL